MHTSLSRIRAGGISLVIVFVAAVFAYRFCGDYTWLDAVWMVVVTISTVGFSEHSESPPAIQIITILLILTGVSFAAYTFGGLVQLGLEGEIEKALGRQKMTREISKLDGHVIICGFGRLGQDLTQQLKHRREDFLIIDSNPEKVLLAGETGILAVHGDATDEAVLEEANLKTAKAIVSALPSDAENVFITLTARNLRSEIQILAKAEQESSCRKLRQAGADKIVMPHRVGAQQMERMISRPTTADLVELFAEASHLDIELDEFDVLPDSVLVGKSLGESRIKENFNLLVVGIKNGDGQFRFNPGPDQTIAAADTMLVIGKVEDVEKLKTAHAV